LSSSDSSSANAKRRTDGPHSEAAPARFLVVTGLTREAACAEGEGVATVCSAADVGILRASLARLTDADFAAVVSFGLAGGLDYGLRPGDVVVGSEAVTGEARFDAHPILAHLLSEGLANAGGKCVGGAVAGVEAPVLDRMAKAELRSRTEAVAVDMESHIAAEFAAARGLPFAIVRVISDPAARALPPLALAAIKPDGGVDLAQVLRELRREPRQIGDLMLAGLDARAAFASLRRCGRLLGPLLRLGLSDL
jgi:adenosylhomocysteine nucleosidase